MQPEVVSARNLLSHGNTTHYYMDGGNQMQSEFMDESPTLNTKTSRNLESLRETAYLIIDNQGQIGTLKLQPTLETDSQRAISDAQNS